jgi:hypothetical protein
MTAISLLGKVHFRSGVSLGKASSSPGRERQLIMNMLLLRVYTNLFTCYAQHNSFLPSNET